MKRLLIVLLLGCFFNVLAQSEEKPGYIITNEQDTTYGVLQYNLNTTNARECFFKSSIADEFNKYEPFDIIGYRFSGGKFYVSKTVILEEKEVEVFTEYLLDGTVDIYYLSYNEDQYFIDRGDGELIELKNTGQEVTLGGSRYLRDKKEYRGILKYAFSDDPKSLKKVESTQLTQKSLISIAEDYHYAVCENGEECVVFAKRDIKPSFRFGPLIENRSIFLSPIDGTFPSTMSFFRGEKRLDTYFNPTIGVFGEMSLSEDGNSKASLIYEVSVSRVNFSKKEIGDISRIGNFDFTYHMKFISINNSLLAKFQLSSKSNLYVLFGVFYNATTSWDHEVRRMSSITDRIVTSTSEGDNPLFNPRDFGAIAGIGYFFHLPSGNQLLVESKYMFGLGYNGVPPVQANHTTESRIFNVHHFTFGLKYSFRKK